MKQKCSVLAAITVGMCATLTSVSRPAHADETIRVTVHADSEGATLRRVWIHEARHRPRTTTQICAAPCSLDIPIGAEYDVAGRGIEPSSIFSFPGGPSAEISVKANVIPNGAAVIMVFFGGCATLAGPLLASAADSGMVGLRDGAITAAALGVPLLAAGIVFLVGPGNTRVYDKDANRLARSSVRLTPGGLTF